jgi:ribosomal protein S18 acetylase RimI-like enzyme
MDLTGVRASLTDHEVRPVLMSDVPLLYTLVERITTHVLGESDANEAELRDDLTGPHFDLQEDTFIAVAPDGRATAYGQGNDERNGSGWIDVYIDPSLDAGAYDVVADAGVSACIARITESVRERGASVVKLTAGLYESEVAMRKAYERAGLHVETVYWRMILTFEPDVEPEQAIVPDGYEIRPVDPNDDAVMAIGHALYRDTFSEHHGFADTDTTLEDYAANWRGAESYDPSAWWFAYEGDEPVGMLLGDNRRAEQGHGYVRSIGVHKSQRGRGLARALLLTAFGHWHAAGRRGVQLGVDTGNVTGATRLYESVGMRSLHSTLALASEVSV